MGIKQRTVPRFQVLDGNGVPLVGGLVYTYQPGTSTAKATYTDYTGDTPNANPVVLDARGEANIWFDGTYKVIVKDSSGNTIYTQDNYGEGEDSVITGNFNLVLNGSFELDTNGDGVPDDWDIVEYTDGTVSLDTDDQIHGAQSLKFVSLGTGGGYATTSFFEVEGSRSIPVSFAIKSSVATVHNQVDIIWHTSAQAVISTTTLYDDTATNPTNWTDKSYSPTAPATARYGKVRLYGCKDDDAQAGTAWFDNVVADAAAVGLFPNVNSQVTATDEELNTMDGITASTAELNIMDGVTVTAAQINKLSELIIPGEVRAYAGSAAPTGWIFCYGQAVSRTTYAVLFAIIGTTYGVGDGSTTFNVPDIRGRTVVGLDNMGGSGANRITGAWADSLGGADGEETHTLTVLESPAHVHTIDGVSEDLDNEGSTWNGVAVSGGSPTSVVDASSSTPVGSSGGDGAHNNVQPSFALNYIIKT